MSWITVTASLYARVTRRAARVAVANWPVLLSVFAYGFIMRFAMLLAILFGPLGGLLLGLVWAACIASFLYLVERLVRDGRVRLEDFPQSFLPYFSDVLGVLFIFWMLRMLLSLALMANPQALLIASLVQLFVFVFLNAVPELLYLGHHSSFDLLVESYRFITENWIEWFPPTLAVSVMLFAWTQLPTSGVVDLAKWAVAALLLYFTMVLRGFLFLELYGSTRRSRAFRHGLG
jgi:hypothetical protein